MTDLVALNQYLTNTRHPRQMLTQRKVKSVNIIIVNIIIIIIVVVVISKSLSAVENFQDLTNAGTVHQFGTTKFWPKDIS